MAKSPNQKLKLLYLAKILLQRTDEAHPMTTQELIAALAEVDISAERKAIYDDLELLRQFGLDVVQVRSKVTGYYIGSRDFELPELKLLVDSVQSSKFITEKKTLSLIRKIESLASCYDAQLLQRQVYVRGRVKSMNESVYYNVDEVSSAITQDREISFKYFEYTPDRQRRFRRNGASYVVSPFALMWDDENYYLLAWDDAASMLKHYRVDKMTEISLMTRCRKGKDAFAELDMSSYSKKIFGMFTGQEQAVRVRFSNHLAGAVLDRFGKDLMLVPYDGSSFTATLDVAVSAQFYAWLFAFGTDAEILSPDSARQEMKRLAASISNMYKI